MAERLRAASVVAFETAHGAEHRDPNMAATAGRALLTQIDQARAAGRSWDDIEATLRHLYRRVP